MEQNEEMKVQKEEKELTQEDLKNVNGGHRFSPKEECSTTIPCGKSSPIS